ncbi:MAG TPA: glycosyltransferase family 39 protein, partial [Polyangiales bacterium]|nr:glycosyltransferase family 39 protein [Polyangiales bacterium]
MIISQSVIFRARDLDLVGSTRTPQAQHTTDAAISGHRSQASERDASRKGRSWDAVAWVVVGLALAIVCATFWQYGVAWDEQGETVYGSMLIDYYRSGFQDHSAFNFVNFRYYGGGFELPAALLARALPLNEYDTRHLLGALIGLVGLIATYYLGRRLFGARAGVLGMLFLLLNPTWYGNIFNNARDVPFATGITLCLLLTVHMLEEMPRISIRNAVLFGLVFGWTTSVRVGGVLAFLFLLAPLALWFAMRLRVHGFDKHVWLSDLRHVAQRLALLCAVAYGVIA